MVDNDLRAGNEAVRRAARAAAQDGDRGPGTAGYTTSGAAYRGNEVAAAMGRPHPAEQGFTQDDGLGYADGGAGLENYPKTQHVEGEVEVGAVGEADQPPATFHLDGSGTMSLTREGVANADYQTETQRRRRRPAGGEGASMEEEGRD